MTSVADTDLEAPVRASRSTTWLPALVAVGAWLLAVLAGLLVRRVAGGHALSASVQVLPLAVGIPLAVVAAVLIAVRPVTGPVAGLLLGAFAGWVSFTLLVALAGTPYGIDGLIGDCGRTTALAEQFRWHLGSTDWYVEHHPTLYPPLWFWVWGRGAALLGRHAWQVEGLFQALGLGAVVLVAGMAWRLVVSWPRAVAAATLTSGLVLFSLSYDPCKGHEVGAALLTLPALLLLHTVLVDVVAGRRRLLLAVVSGVLLGVCFLLYQLFVVFAAPGVAVLWLALGLRAHRLRAVLGHVLVGAAVALVTISWWVLPLLGPLSRPHAARARDLAMVLFSLKTPPGLPVTLTLTLNAVVVVGALAMAARVRHPLAQALLAVLGASLAVQTAAMLSVIAGGSSLLSYRTVPWLTVTCGAAAALLVLGPVSRLAARIGMPDPGSARRMAAAGLAIALISSGYGAWTRWHPPTVGVEAKAGTYQQEAGGPQHATALAYLSRLPSCKPVRGLPRTVKPATCVPGTAVQRCIEEALGKGAQPVLVAYDERFSLFYGNHLYLGNNPNSASPFDDWQERYQAIKRMQAEHDPQRFLELARSAPFGPIQGFVLATGHPGTWRWVVQRYKHVEQVDFLPAQFADPAWHVCTAPNTVVAVQAGQPG